MLQGLPGTYVVILLSLHKGEINVGKRLSLSLQKGYYAYIGSAFGRGGIASRIRHHTGMVKRPHWHLDYLHAYTRVIEVWFSYDSLKRECQWAELLASIGALYIPIKGFGATDCACLTHLMYSSTRPDFKQFRQTVMQQITNHQAIDFLTMESCEDGNR